MAATDPNPNALQQAFLNAIAGLVIPRNSRRIQTPLAGVNIRSMSDLFPTAAVTEQYPVIGTTTYGQMTPANRQTQNTAFQSFVLLDMKEEFRDGAWFTRCFFGDPAVDSLGTPVTTTEGYEMFEWYPVLEWITFTKDFHNMVRVETDTGPRLQHKYHVEYGYRPGLRCKTKIMSEWFLSTKGFDLSSEPITYVQPSDVSWDIDPLGHSGAFPECLHPKIIVPSIRGGQIVEKEYPQTNVTAWIDQVYTFDVINEDNPNPYYIGVRRTAIAPPMAEIIKVRR